MSLRGVTLLAAGALACSNTPAPTLADASAQDTVDVVMDSPSDTAHAEPDVASACGLCEALSEPSDLGTVRSTLVAEASGIAASDRDPGVYFVHNDSGDTARFFAVRAASGVIVGEYRLTGVRAVDHEDIAVGPCGAGRCVFLADIGDNAMVRGEYVVHQVSEPSAGEGIHEVSSVEHRFVYPDGAHNAESLLVASDGRMYVVTKNDTGDSGVYRFPTPLRPGERVTLQRIAALRPPRGSNLFTGGSAHPCEPAFLLRTYNRLWLYRAPAGGSFEQAFEATPEAMPVATEAQGEAVGFNPDGRGFVTISEGADPVVHAVGCR